jgi:hypothetical protein
MNGKSSTQVTRISCVFKALETACTILANQIDVAQKEITREFGDNVVKLVTQLKPDSFIIDLSIAQKAIKCIEYFNLNKLILSGYDIDPAGTFEDAFSKIVNLRTNRSALASHFASLSSNILRLMKRAFMVPYTRINASKLGANNVTVAIANEVFQKLEEYQLGVQESVTSSNYHQTNYFIRISSKELLNNQALGKCIVDLGLNLQSVVKCLQETEFLEASNANDSRTVASKRPRTFDAENSPPNVLSKKNKASSITKVIQRKDNGIPYLITKPITYDEDAREPFQNLNANSINTKMVNNFSTTLTINGMSIENGEVNLINGENKEILLNGKQATTGNEANIEMAIQPAGNNFNEDGLGNNDVSTIANLSEIVGNNNSNGTLGELGTKDKSTQDSNQTDTSFGIGSSINTSVTNSSISINSNKESQLTQPQQNEDANHNDVPQQQEQDQLVNSRPSNSNKANTIQFIRKIDPKTGQSKRGRLSKEEQLEKLRIQNLNNINGIQNNSENSLDPYEFRESDHDSVSARTRSRSNSNSRNTQEEGLSSRPRTSTQINKPLTVVPRKKRVILTKTFTPRHQ